MLELFHTHLQEYNIMFITYGINVDQWVICVASLQETMETETSMIFWNQLILMEFYCYIGHFIHKITLVEDYVLGPQKMSFI